MFDVSDTAIFLIVVGLRLLVPLAIPRYPLPAIIAAATLDGLDLGIFTGLTNLDTTNYQSYDKALDIYYQTIAYLSTMRNWTNVDAVAAARILFYIRLTGSLLFELSEFRPMLLIFPNTFEFFFIAYHLITLRWDPARLTRRDIIGMTAFIWIVIKLPQEYWIHVAQRDASDLLLENPVLILLLVILGVMLIAGVRWLMEHKLPPADVALRFEARNPMKDPIYLEKREAMVNDGLLGKELFEKIVLISIVSIIFSQMLPNVAATPMQLSLAVTILVVANTALSEWLYQRSDRWRSTPRNFAGTSVLNIGLTFTFLWVLPMEMSGAALRSTLFFILLITLLVTYYDQYRPSYLMHREKALQETESPVA